MIEGRESNLEREISDYAPTERRRSDRLEVTLPVRVEGVDWHGERVEYEGRARGLGRYGARIEIPWPLDSSYPIRVWSTLRRMKVANFRVVPLNASEGWTSGYGIECLEEGDNFWGISFPQAGATEEIVARALLECRLCHTLALLPLTISEVEALRMIGRLGKQCSNCQTVSPWKYADVQDMERRPTWARAAIDPISRTHRRVYIQHAAEILDAQGGTESIWTENMSRGGFCFASAKPYSQGDLIHARFRLDSKSEKTDLPARIVREQAITGSGRRLYGVIFEARKDSSPLWA